MARKVGVLHEYELINGMNTVVTVNRKTRPYVGLQFKALGVWWLVWGVRTKDGVCHAKCELALIC
jgi:hypothetical protein